MLAGAYGEVAGTLMTPVRGAEGSEWAAGWVAARELITLRLLALAEAAFELGLRNDSGVGQGHLVRPHLTVNRVACDLQ